MCARDRLMVVSGSLALLKADGVRRTGRKTVSKAVTVIVADQLRLSVDHRDRAFLAGRRACAAAVAFLFINFYDGSFQFNGFPFQIVVSCRNADKHSAAFPVIIRGIDLW